MNLKEIREIINLMNENGLAEMEVEREGSKIKLKKVSGQIVHVEQSSQVQPVVVSQAQDQSKVQESPAIPAGEEIKSPMVGTFYRASSPDVASYVEVGQIVEVGQVLCIIEAMKLMNEIKSEV
ncbi:MAG: acetyl-CoA carboxylase biotin carboxyl carrier protein, partial [Candidatus Zapsychrus exili]|nr:acetyl-CoA carboxylase biotin carboxyl carrier protein [Candidatus Zapsychrus exili]